MNKFLVVFLSLVSLAFGTIIEVSSPGSSGQIDISSGMDTIEFSTGSRLFFGKLDRTTYTNGGSGDYYLSFVDTISTAKYVDSIEMPFIAHIKLSDVGNNTYDTIGIYQSHPTYSYDHFGVMKYQVLEGCYKPFQICVVDHPTIQVDLVAGEFASAPSILKWSNISVDTGNVSILGIAKNNKLSLSTIVQKEIKIFSTNGRLVRTFTNMALSSIDSSVLPCGAYLAVIEGNNFTTKLSIQ